MNLKKWKPYLISALIALGIGGLSGLLSMAGMEEYAQNAAKPALTPPGWLFAVAWTLFYVVMGIGAARIFLSPKSIVRDQGLNLYVAQLIVNFFWSLIFFNAQAFGFAVLWLILLIVLVALMIYSFYRADKLAAFLQIPYFLWLLFALYLNIGVWMLNG